jgi:hypothetical protein
VSSLSTIVRGAALAALVLISGATASTASSAATPPPAETGNSRAQAGTMPLQTATTPGQTATMPGPTATTPGQTGTTPGQTDTTPGQSGATPPGEAGTTPGRAGTAPGKAGTTPGKSGSAPRRIPHAVPPVIGRSMALRPVAGSVKVRLPHSSAYVSLSDAGSVPAGAVVDARAGTVELRSAVDAAGRTQTARLRGALFEVRQAADGKGMTDLILRGGRPRSCPAKGSAAVARAAAGPTTSGPRTSGLWAKDDHGRFRSRGRNSTASVRGTEWVTRETCAGTLTKVIRGAVDVYDRHTKRTVRVRAGHGYVARDAR